MNKYILFCSLATLSFSAEETPQHSILPDIVGTILPIIIFFGIWILLSKKITKNSGVHEAAESNLKLAESNLEIASQLKRIADILEKKEQ